MQNAFTVFPLSDNGKSTSDSRDLGICSVKIPDEVLAKVEVALSEQDPVKAKALSDEIIKDLYDDCWMVPFYSNAMGFILRTDVKDSGVEDFADWSLWSPENVWLDR